MIRYEVDKFYRHFFQVKGSVFPFAFCVAFPCSALAFALKYIELSDGFDGDWGWIRMEVDSAAFSGFNFLVNFLVVFRTSQAYARFWDALVDTHRMCAEWFDACSSVIAFTRRSKIAPEEVTRFQQTLIRLFSMLNAVALQELSDDHEMRLEGFELIDGTALDAESLGAVEESEAKVELVFQWIQQLIVDAQDRGVVATAPPIVSRAFQELASGMVCFHDAMKIAKVPFPFPYTQTTTLLLIMHWLLTPFMMMAWTEQVHAASIYTFVQVFILWSLNTIASEIQNPFGRDPNDIDAAETQETMNKHLLMLVTPVAFRLPKICEAAETDPSMLSQRLDSMHNSVKRARSSQRQNFSDILVATTPHFQRVSTTSLKDTDSIVLNGISSSSIKFAPEEGRDSQRSLAISDVSSTNAPCIHEVGASSSASCADGGTGAPAGSGCPSPLGSPQPLQSPLSPWLKSKAFSSETSPRLLPSLQPTAHSGFSMSVFEEVLADLPAALVEAGLAGPTTSRSGRCPESNVEYSSSRDEANQQPTCQPEYAATSSVIPIPLRTISSSGGASPPNHNLNHSSSSPMRLPPHAADARTISSSGGASPPNQNRNHSLSSPMRLPPHAADSRHG